MKTKSADDNINNDAHVNSNAKQRILICQTPIVIIVDRHQTQTSHLLSKRYHGQEPKSSSPLSNDKDNVNKVPMKTEGNGQERKKENQKREKKRKE